MRQGDLPACGHDDGVTSFVQALELLGMLFRLVEQGLEGLSVVALQRIST